MLACALLLSSGPANAQAGATPPAAALQTGSEAHSGKAPATDDVCRTVEDAAAENGLPVEFFARVIWQESRFNARAVSPKGASGILSRRCAIRRPIYANCETGLAISDLRRQLKMQVQAG